MKPNKLQLIFSSVWYVNFKWALVIAMPIIALIYFLRVYWNEDALLLSLSSILIVIAGFVTSMQVLTVLNWIHTKINGGMIRVGDRVGVLAGEKKGLTGRVTEVQEGLGKVFVVFDKKNF
jgi:hypothetical protein